MKNGVALVLGCITGYGLLLVRRLIRIRLAQSKLHQLARICRWQILPRGYYRVAISGVSSGIGRTIVEVLQAYPTIDLIGLGRQEDTAVNIKVDLTDEVSVRAAVHDLVGRWYGNREVISPGQDVFINNAGVFASVSEDVVWKTNFISPAFITESLTSNFTNRDMKGRSLRFVQVASRLEKRSELDLSNAAYKIRNGLINRSQFVAQDIYADTKRALLLHTAFLSSLYESNERLSFMAVTPGMVNTNLGKTSVSKWIWWLSFPFRLVLLRHPIEGAVSVLWAAFGYPKESGLYTGDPDEIIEVLKNTRDTFVGGIVSETVHEHYNIV
jgi:NAD(P)-dependent dehydrogenase (short-subunit alcohol dehydrogenase family)